MNKRFLDAKYCKKHSFSDEAGADLEPLNRPCFHWSSRAQKSGSHSRHAGGPFQKISSVFISFRIKSENILCKYQHWKRGEERGREIVSIFKQETIQNRWRNVFGTQNTAKNIFLTQPKRSKNTTKTKQHRRSNSNGPQNREHSAHLLFENLPFAAYHSWCSKNSLYSL